MDKKKILRVSLIAVMMITAITPIAFAGSPPETIYVTFTPSGDIVDEIDHDSNEGIHEWFQITKYNQFIVSGVYIYVIESKEGLGSTIGKFIIIR